MSPLRVVIVRSAERAASEVSVFRPSNMTEECLVLMAGFGVPDVDIVRQARGRLTDEETAELEAALGLTREAL